MTRSRKPEISNNRKQIPASDTTVLSGLPITSLARTWWDIAEVLDLADVVAAGDRALQLGATRVELSALVRRQHGRRGNRTARAAVGWLDERSRSRPESHLRVCLLEAAIDCFDVNEPIHEVGGGWLAEPDLSCQQAKIALEYQGADHADVKRLRGDITRETDLRRNGWLTLYYGPAQVFGRPWLIAPEVRRLVDLRAPGLLLPRTAPLKPGSRRKPTAS